MGHTTCPPPAFVGWWRRHRREAWQPVVESDSRDGCWMELLDFPRAGDKCVTPGTVDPNQPEPAP